VGHGKKMAKYDKKMAKYDKNQTEKKGGGLAAPEHASNSNNLVQFRLTQC